MSSLNWKSRMFVAVTTASLLTGAGADVGSGVDVVALASATAPAPVSRDAVVTATNMRLFQFRELMVMSFRQSRECRVMDEPGARHVRAGTTQRQGFVKPAGAPGRCGHRRPPPCQAWSQ